MRPRIGSMIASCLFVMSEVVAQTGSFLRLQPERLLREEDVDRACQRGQELVLEFYRSLLSGRPATELPNIFKAEDSAKIWTEVLADKEVFLLDEHARWVPDRAWDIHDLGEVRIVFEGARKGGRFWESYVCIEIRRALAPAVCTNEIPVMPMMKQVSFGIAREGNDYRIDPWKLCVGAIFWVPVPIPRAVRVACPENMADVLGWDAEQVSKQPIEPKRAENRER